MATRIRNVSPEIALLAPTINALRQQIGAGASYHLDALEYTVTAATAVDLPTSIALLNQIAAVYALHIPDTLAQLIADTVNVNAAAAAVDLATSQTLANALKTAFNAHLAQSGVHYNNDVVFSQPAAPTVAPQGTTGAATVSYGVVAVDGAGRVTQVSSNGTTSSANATLSLANFNRVSWAKQAGASAIKIYRTAGGPSQGLIATLAGSAVELDDTGLAGDASTAPAVNLTGSTVTAANATDLASTQTLANALKASLNAHIGSAPSPGSMIRVVNP